MARAKKLLLRSGIYEAPQGTLRATPARVRHWAGQFAEMKSLGIKIPCGWGHQPDAWPLDPRGEPDRARQQYHLSAYNAGYLDDMRATGAAASTDLAAVLDCPGVELDGDKLVHWVRLPDGRQVKSAVGEVSVAIKDWKDGTGRIWPDAIVHVALTPLPVAHNHGGFSLGSCTDDGSGFTLSLHHMTHTLSADGEGDIVADDTDKDSKKKDDKAKPFEKKEGGGAEGGSKDHFAEGMEFLRARGIGLPDDTTAENFWERLCVVGHALDHAETSTGEDMIDEPLDEPMPAEPEPAVFDGTEEAPIEEQQPVMMSLATAKDPATKAMLSREQDRHRGQLSRRIDRLVKRGLKPALAAELREKASSYTLSLDGEYNPVTKRLDERITDLELSLPERHPLAGLKTTGEAPRPDLRTESTQKRQEDAGDELAILAGATIKRN